MSVLALAQPWIIRLVEKYARPGSVDTYETGYIEVGYDFAFGATIGLHGTLRARDRDLFVRSMQVEIRREKDQARHQFEWRVFRTGKLVLGRAEEVTWELPAGFMLMTSQPYRYNVVFGDVDLDSERRPVLDGVQRAWDEAAAQIREKFASDPEQLRAAERAQYSEFTRQHAYTEAFDHVNRMRYWEPGHYQLSMTVHTARPDRSFLQDWSFELTSDDVNRLRLNPVAILATACGQYDLGYPFYYAYPRYDSPHSDQATVTESLNRKRLG